ncbi:hypothetical protein [Methanocella paludicola]|nr:hypothetical protein [Methanocella paludicola]
MDKTLIVLGVLVLAGIGLTAAMVVTSPAQGSPNAVPPAPGNPVHPNDPTVMQNDKLTMAKQFVMDDATFQFDGMADTVIAALDEGTGIATIEFTSRTAGYGNRSGMIVAEVLTAHKAAIKISGNQVVSAVMDEKWDMLTQKEIA